MPTLEQPKLISCGKCGMQAELGMFRRKDSRACPLCSEPIQELIEMDRCDRSSGDYFPAKEERE